MDNEGKNEGFRVLNDLVSETTPAPAWWERWERTRSRRLAVRLAPRCVLLGIVYGFSWG